ncbi:unnamed protein product [Symbiodinium necroappetens]|uniref:Uncharacterized protein n=1 Tax=Symbiodinium necroappetens TaxID=1628268 RepID=A0A813BTY8_9DINO|nr:unnamed protein product [Symbiodinium necroappetens]
MLWRIGWEPSCFQACFFSVFISGATRAVRFPFLVFGAVCALGFLPAAHYVRKSFREQEEMFRSFSEFDVSELSCFSDFDKRFILSAVIQWYGSLEDFSLLVRGPLKEELLHALQQSRWPLGYCVLSITPFLSVQLEWLAGLLSAGAHFDAWGRIFFGQILATNMLVVCESQAFFWLARRLSQPRFAHPVLDFGQTVLVVALFVCTLLPLVVVFRAYQTSLVGGILGALVAAVILWVTVLRGHPGLRCRVHEV